MKIILIFFGPPGSGKGTQAQMLSKKLKLPAVSPGELFRREIVTKTKLGKQLDNFLSKGELVPNKTVYKIIDKRLDEKDIADGFILDGYPREKNQLDYLVKKLDKITSKSDKIFAILVDVSDKEVKNRLGGRRICSCGASYHLKFNPSKKKGICDLCGSKLYVRSDDTSGIIASRLSLYHKESAFILKYWDKKDKLIKINGEQSIQNVQKDIIKRLKEVNIK